MSTTSSSCCKIQARGATGYELIVASDGVHALSQARQLKPNLILLDILLPDLDGLSVCEILRRQPATKKIAHHIHECANG